MVTDESSCLDKSHKSKSLWHEQTRVCHNSKHYFVDFSFVSSQTNCFKLFYCASYTSTIFILLISRLSSYINIKKMCLLEISKVIIS